jgi:hypothetical protein
MPTTRWSPIPCFRLLVAKGRLSSEVMERSWYWRRLSHCLRETLTTSRGSSTLPVPAELCSKRSKALRSASCTRLRSRHDTDEPATISGSFLARSVADMVIAASFRARRADQYGAELFRACSIFSLRSSTLSSGAYRSERRLSSIAELDLIRPSRTPRWLWRPRQERSRRTRRSGRTLLSFQSYLIRYGIVCTIARSAAWFAIRACMRVLSVFVGLSRAAEFCNERNQSFCGDWHFC